MHRIHSLLACTCITLTCLAGAVPRAAATPRLDLDAHWYTIVEPYRYVEARSYERGWNRGADAAVVGGLVRAPVGGTVRFAGDVAGRTVVTLQTEVDGLPVVVTLTGNWSSDAAPGDRIRRGQAIGSGAILHVGMYDRARRSRYLPVVSSGRATAAMAPPGSIDRSTVSGSLAGRLHDAILGRAESAQDGGGDMDPSPGSALLAPSADATGGGAPAPISTAASTASVPRPRRDDASVFGVPRVLRSVGTGHHPAPGRGAVEPSDAPSRPGSSRPARGEDLMGVASAWVVSAPQRVGAPAGATTDAGAVPDAGAPEMPSVGNVPKGHGPWTGGRRALRGSSDEVVAVSTDDVASDLGEPIVVDRLGSSHGPSPRSRNSSRIGAAHWPGLRWSLPVGLVAFAVAVALVVLVGLRRRRAPRRAPTRVHVPWAPAIPAVSRPRVHAVHTDGSTILPCAEPAVDARALAWADREPGTSGSTDTRSSAASRQRAPEHA